MNQIRKTHTNKKSDSQAQKWVCRGADGKLVCPKILTDDQNCIQIASKENDIDDKDVSISTGIRKMSLSEAMNVLNTVLQWAEYKHMDSTEMKAIKG